MTASTDPITWQSLTTAGGASVGAILLVSFIRVFFSNVPEHVARSASALMGLLLVEVAIIALNGIDPLELGLGLFVGIQAGLAASKVFEVATSGYDHVTAPRQSALPPPQGNLGNNPAPEFN